MGKMYFLASNFVNLRGLRKPDGRPLYEYMQPMMNITN